MNRSLPYWSGPIDCVACGASAESGLSIATVSEQGTDSSCLCCDFIVWRGAVLVRGTELAPKDVVGLVQTRTPGLPASDAYREPSDRRHVLALRAVPTTDLSDQEALEAVPEVEARAISSITVRFGRSRPSSGAGQ